MNAYAILAVNEHLEYLRDEVRSEPRRDTPYPARASASGSRRRSMVSVAPSRARRPRPQVLPKLQDYPYRG